MGCGVGGSKGGHAQKARLPGGPQPSSLSAVVFVGGVLPGVQPGLIALPDAPKGMFSDPVKCGRDLSVGLAAAQPLLAENKRLIQIKHVVLQVTGRQGESEERDGRLGAVLGFWGWHVHDCQTHTKHT